MEKSQIKYGEAWFISLLKVLLYTGVTGAALSNFTSTLGVISGVSAAFLAALLGPFLVKSRLRALSIFLISLMSIFLGSGLNFLFAYSGSLATSIGIENSIRINEFFSIGSSTFGFLLAVRCAALFWPSMSLVESSLFALFFVWKLSVHRDLTLHRPRYLSDFAWDLGFNPIIILLTLGSFLLAISSALLIKSKRFFSATVQLFLIIMISTAVFFYYKDLKLHLVERDNTFGLSNPHDPNSHIRGSKGQQGGNQQNQGNQQGSNQGQGNQQGSNQGQGNQQGNNQGQGNQQGSNQGQGNQQGNNQGQGNQQGSNQGQGNQQGNNQGQGNQQGSNQGQGNQQGNNQGQGNQQDQNNPQGQDGRRSEQNQNESNSGGKSNPDEMPFKNNYDSQNKNLPVALVKFETDYVSPLGYYYFRQTAFSEFNGSRLVQSSGIHGDNDIIEYLPFEGPIKVEDLNPIYDKNSFQEVETSVFLLVEPTKPYGLSNPTSMQRTTNPNSSFFSSAYQVKSRAPVKKIETLLSEYLALPKWKKDKMKAYTEVPEDPRYRKLALQIIATLKDGYEEMPFAQALSIVYYLGQTGYYSLKSDHADAKDPTASFLFGNRTGYCVHFSHAAVYLMRSIGLPARVGAGYAVPDKRRAKGENLAIMERDAHAWPEVYLEPYGWIVIDVPIQNFLDPPTSEPSQSLQNTLGDIAKNGSPKPPELEDEMGEDDSTQLLESLKAFIKMLLKILFYLLITLSLSFILFSYLYKAWRLWFWKRGQGKALTRKAMIASIDRLHYAGKIRTHGESREDFAKRCIDVSPSFQTLTSMHLAARLGTLKDISSTQVIDLSIQIKKDIKKNQNFWKKFIFTLNPISWLRSK